MNIEHQKTIEVLKWFEELNKIPRGSKNEAQIGRWLMDWAKENRFNAQQDETGNVVITVPASPGYENAPTVIIQGHMDMVCEKTPDSNHDFTKDSIKSVYDGEWLKADNTTLGADNGIAIAMGMVAALDKNLKHPPMELLFTVDEETGLTGAFALKPGFIEGNILLNLDSEEDGVFTVGCAGGQKSDHTLPLDYEPVPGAAIPVTLNASEMAGGHSADIHHEKANAIKVLARTLHEILADMPVRMTDIKGGTVDNAIPRDAETIIFIPKDKLETAKTITQKMETVFKSEFKNTDPDLKLSLSPLEKHYPETMTEECTQKVIQCLLAIPHGIWAMSTEVEHFVETSNNLASLKIEDKQLQVVTSQRSPVVTRLDAVTLQIESVVRLVGGTTINRDKYPGWNANMESAILKKSVAVYEKMFNKKPVVETTHGGLECGVISSIFPTMDMISFGPTIKNPHSPEEKIHIGSIGKAWDFFETLLDEISRQ
ncbi:MAG: aminoacyl-histidine dipeptidase [bacterium]|nr:aminoacyl-histidine dipeptidase [bacterium]